MSDELLTWYPSPVEITRSRVLDFIQRYNVGDMKKLLASSISKPDTYWQQVAEYLDIEWFEPWVQVLNPTDPQDHWYSGAKINFVHNALDKYVFPASHTHRRPDASCIALIFEDSAGKTQHYSYADLYQQVNQAAHALATLGIRVGDVVALLVPLLPESIVALLACGKLGAICAPIPLSTTHQVIAQDLIRTNAKLLITVDGYFVDHTFIHTKSIADRASVNAEALDTIVTIQHTQRGVSWLDGRDIWWHEILRDQSTQYPTYHARPNQAYLLDLRVATGLPIPHLHGGAPIKFAHDPLC